MIVERVEHPEWLSNAYLVAERPGGHGVFIDSNGLTETLEERTERETERVLREHGARGEDVQAHMDHVRNSLTALTGRAVD